MDAKQQKKLLMAIVAGIVVATIIADFIIHPHHDYFFWQKPQLDLLFGLAGAFLLMFFSLGLGEFFLWRYTCSVVLDEKDSGFGYRTATLRAWLVESGQKVTAGQPLARMENGRGDEFTVSAPLDGRVSKCFVDPGEEVSLGQTVVDLACTKHDLHALEEGHGEEATHA
jgi:hypothetical protein